MSALRGRGKSIPFQGSSFGAVLMALTLCFVGDPLEVVTEATRVLRPDGGVMPGVMPRGTPWADRYAERGSLGDPFYRSARFHSWEELLGLVSRAGLRMLDARASLFQQPAQARYVMERPVEGYSPSAGFVAVAAVKASRRSGEKD